MQDNNLLLIMQLIRAINYQTSILQKSYDNSDKEEFDKAKTAILDSQNKLSFLLNNDH